MNLNHFKTEAFFLSRFIIFVFFFPISSDIYQESVVMLKVWRLITVISLFYDNTQKPQSSFTKSVESLRHKLLSNKAQQINRKK